MDVEKKKNSCIFCLRNNENFEAKHWYNTWFETICADGIYFFSFRSRLPSLQYMLCNKECFSIRQSAACQLYGNRPFVSSSLYSERNVFIDNCNIVKIVDQNNEEQFSSHSRCSWISCDLKDNLPGICVLGKWQT